jgi:hypothetical protein
MKIHYLLFCYLFSLPFLEAQDCFNQFQYYRTISLQPEAGQGSIAAHTVAVPFDSKSLVEQEKLQITAADLRVVDADCNPLPFFVQDVANRNNNILYIAIPDLSQEGIEIQIYYGSRANVNPVIDGSSVFLFFDDFEDGILDTDNWENIGAYTRWEEADGKLHFAGDSGTGGIFQYVTPKVAYSGPITFDFAAPANNNKVYGICDTSDIERVGFRYQSGAQSNDTMDIYALLRDTTNGGFFPGDFYPYVVVERDKGNIMSISATIDPFKTLIVDRFENYSNGEVNSNNLTVNQMEFDAIRPFFSSFGASIELEYLGIRNTPQGFPIITWGPEIPLTVSTNDLLGSELFECYPNPASDLLQVKYHGTGDFQVNIFNQLGQLVHTQYENVGIDVSSWPKGSYVVKMQGGRQLQTAKVLIR